MKFRSGAKELAKSNSLFNPPSQPRPLLSRYWSSLSQGGSFHRADAASAGGL